MMPWQWPCLHLVTPPCLLKADTAKPRHIHDQQQHAVGKTLDVGDANGESTHADSAERTEAGNDDRR